MDKIVYVCLCADLFHHGHLNIIIKARNLGKVVVGLMTDKAMKSYKRVPILAYKNRKKIVKNIVGVSKIIPCRSLSYVPMIKKVKPDYVVHGDDWKNPNSAQYKESIKVAKYCRTNNIKLIEPKYTKGISTTTVIERIKDERKPF